MPILVDFALYELRSLEAVDLIWYPISSSTVRKEFLFITFPQQGYHEICLGVFLQSLECKGIVVFNAGYWGGRRFETNRKVSLPPFATRLFIRSLAQGLVAYYWTSNGQIVVLKVPY